MKPTRDQLEYLISQSLDGTLNPVEQTVLDEILATDADARAVLEEYRRLDTVVKSAMPMPQIDWDAFSASISQQAGELEVPVRHYRLRFATASMLTALAAMVLIAFGIVMKFRGGPGTPNVEVGTRIATNTTPIDVQISAPPVLTASAVTEISIGQPSGLAVADFHSSDLVVTRPTSFWMIASGSNSAQDSEPSLY